MQHLYKRPQIFLLWLLFFACGGEQFLLVPYPLYAQCASLPAQPSCSPCTATSNNETLTTGNTRCVTSTTTHGNYGLNGGILIVCSGSLQVNNFSFGSNGGTIYVAAGASLQIGNSGGSGVPNMDGNVTVVNRGTLVFTAGFSMQGSNPNRIFTASGATTTIAGEVSLNSSSSSLVNYGTVNANGGLRYQGGTTCMGLGSCINTTNLTVNSNNPLTAPSGAAAIRVTGQRQLNNPLTATSNVRFCRASSSTQNGGNEPSGYGSATIVSNCPSCSVALPNIAVRFSAEALSGKVHIRVDIPVSPYRLRFFIERLIDGNFVPFVEKLSEAATRSFEIVDESPRSGLNYYRLRILLADGNEVSSQVALVDLSPEASRGVRISPNPMPAHVEGVSIVGLAAGEYQVVIHNVLGQIIHSTRIVVVADKPYWYILPSVLCQSNGVSYWRISELHTGKLWHSERVMLQAH